MVSDRIIRARTERKKRRSRQGAVAQNLKIEKHEATPGNAEDLSSLIYVRLSSILVKSFLSSDPGDGANRIKNREGVLEISINGQATTFSWSTDGNGNLKNPERIMDHVVYVGKPEKRLPFTMRIIEADKARFAAVQKKVESFLGIVEAGAAFTPPYGAAISAGSSLIKTIMKTAGNQVDDDNELIYTGCLLSSSDAAKKEVDYHVGRLDTTGEFQLAVAFHVRSIKAVAPSSGKVKLKEVRRLIQATGPAGTLINVKQSLNKLPDDANVTSTYELERPEPPKEFPKISVYLQDCEIYLPGIDGDDSLQFELKVGDGEALKFTELVNGAEQLHQVIALRDHLLYQGDWKGVLPIAASVVALPDETTEDFSELFSSATEFASQVMLLDGASKEDVAQLQSDVSKISKVALSIQSFLAEYDPDKITIGMLSGMLITPPTGADANLSSSRIIPLAQNSEAIVMELSPAGVRLNPNNAGTGKRVILKLQIEKTG